MEWLILLLVVPAVVLPVVGLWGFAGCSFSARAVPPPPVLAPVNLQAIAKTDQRIDLTWKQGDANTVSYRIDRAPDGGPFVTINNVTDTNFIDDNIVDVNGNGLVPNTKYFYQVRTIVAGPSLSDPAEANAKTFAVAFQIDPALPPRDHTDMPEKFCYVQRIPAAQLLADGSKLRLQVWGSPSGNATIHAIYISRVANPGDPNDYQSAGDIEAVLASNSNLTLTNDQPIFLPDPANDPIDYTLDQTMDLIIALDFSTTPGQGNSRHVDQPLVDLHWKPGVQQAANYVGGPFGLRDPNYIFIGNRLDFVTKVIVS